MAGSSLIAAVERALKARSPERAGPGSFEIEAAVSLMLRDVESGLEFLAIKRSESDRDPWSGHMALPGGRREAEDESLWQTAVRETLEEVGIDLESAGRRLGQLDDVAPRSRLIPAIAITPFVAEVDRGAEVLPSSEVDRAVWVPVAALVEPRYHGRLVLRELQGREFPTIEYEGYIIWGLTHAVLGQLAAILQEVGYDSRR